LAASAPPSVHKNEKFDTSRPASVPWPDCQPMARPRGKAVVGVSLATPGPSSGQKSKNFGRQWPGRRAKSRLNGWVGSADTLERKLFFFKARKETS